MNSFIRSKNKVNRTVESQAIKNINIDKKIEEYKKWQSLIKKELDLMCRGYETLGEKLQMTDSLHDVCGVLVGVEEPVFCVGYSVLVDDVVEMTKNAMNKYSNIFLQILYVKITINALRGILLFISYKN